jgi:hypothetical protein
MSRRYAMWCWRAFTLRFGLISLLCLIIARPALADRKPTKQNSVAVRVVDLADDRAYLEPGSSAGIAVGDEVKLGGERYKVSATSNSFAVLALGGKTLALGARGTALVANPNERVELAPEPPTPLSQFRSEWRTAALPAAKQSPQPVPLGRTSAGRRTRNRFILSDGFYGVVPLNGESAFVGNEVRGRLHFEPYSSAPLAFDADLGVQTYWGEDFGQRPGAAARQLLRLRELSLTYGTASTFRGLLGRLRAASSMVGQVDGVRLEAPLSSELRLSAYGGAVPHTFNGMFSTQVARFGAELAYQDVTASWQPRVLAGAYASHFAGALDEKKAYAAFDLLPAQGRLGGHAQLSLFDANNPWRASSVELSSAGLDAAAEFGVFHVGGRAQMQRPDRSRWLSSLLPAEWLCWSSPARASAPCSPSDATFSWLVDGGVRAGRLSVDLGGQSTFTRGTDGSSFGGFANLRWLDLVGKLHLDAGMSVLSGSVLRSAAATVAPGILFADGRGDLSLRYRPALVRYRATLRSSLEHSLGAGLWLAPTDDFDFDLEGDWLRALDVNALLVQGVATWNLGI